ncbi:MAG: DUF4397 domain-containing protein [Armatimonadetes bacterium]|nr:DUF4397 domain-containing protein [Armatimonadota bacterium]
MRPLVTIACLSTLALALVGCGSSSSGTSPRLRVVHASPNAPQVDVLIDDVRELSSVPYKASSPYLGVFAGTRNVKVNAAGTSTTVINANLTLLNNTDTTVLATGRLASIEPLVLTDNNTPPTAGNIKLRLVHSAPGAGNVDIYVTAPTASLASATPNFSNVPFKGASSYLNVPAGTYRVRITPAGTKTVAIDSGSVTLTAGQIRTAVAVGDPGVGQDLGAIILADN